MKLLRILLPFIICLATLSAANISKDKVTGITIRGNKKVTSDVVKSKMLQKEGSPYKEQFIRQDIKNIFSLGYFDNIDAYKDVAPNGVQLFYDVKEKPIISSIVFEGNSDIDKEDLEKQINIKTYTVVDIAAIKKARAALLKYYEEKGFFLASIKDELRPAPKDPEAETDDS
ncbi:MAG: POTRA domain-containing protein, partial [Pseudomonadota bacterium]